MARNRHAKKKYEFDVPATEPKKSPVLRDLVQSPEDLDFIVSQLAVGTQLRITPAGNMVVSKIPAGFIPKRRRV